MIGLTGTESVSCGHYGIGIGAMRARLGGAISNSIIKVRVPAQASNIAVWAPKAWGNASSLLMYVFYISVSSSNGSDSWIGSCYVRRIREDC